MSKIFPTEYHPETYDSWDEKEIEKYSKEFWHIMHNVVSKGG